MAERVVIVGAGLAGAHAADTLREEGFDGEVVLVGAEPHLPYDRPPLSKTFLQGAPEEVPDDPTYNAESHYAERRVELVLGVEAQGLDPRAREVELAGGRRLGYDRLLLATGSRVRRLAVPGAELPGVFYLRTLDDARALREAVARSRRVVVVGAGFIGAEVAASCRQRGLEVAVLEAAPAPLWRALGEEVGLRLAELHRAHGVDVRLGTAVDRFRGQGRLEQVVTTGGAALDCDLAVVGIGVDPATAWLAGSGLQLEDGVVVDARCRASAPGVYACGDCARWPHGPTGARLRVEHWDHAWNHAEAAAREICGRGEDYDPVLYFWSDQYEVEIQYFGHAVRWDRVVLRGDPGEGHGAAFYLDGGLLRAVMTVGAPEEADGDAIRALLRAGAHPDPAALADPGTPLADLAGKA